MTSLQEVQKQFIDQRPNALLQNHRMQAFQKFISEGWPNSKSEQWKYVDTRSLSEQPYQLAPVYNERDAGRLWENFLQEMGDLENTLVFFNGTLQGQYLGTELKKHVYFFRDFENWDSFAVSIFKGLLLESHKRADALHSLNEAFLAEGCFIHIPSGVLDDLTLNLVSFVDSKSVDKPFMLHPRVLIHLAENSKLSLRQIQQGFSGEYFENFVVDVKVGSGAELDYVLAQQAGTRGRSVSQSSFWISEGGKVKAFTVSKGSLLTRTQINLYSEGESTQTQLYGIFLGDDKSHVDVRTNSEHLKPKGVSTQVQKGILFDEARGVFNGKITIAIDAQEVDAHMLNQNLLLGDLAEIDTKPELDVYADNVKASHGATVGSVNEDELFYLQSRGIGREQAQELIIQGFVLSELKHIESEQVRTWIKNLLMKKLSVTKEVFGG